MGSTHDAVRRKIESDDLEVQSLSAINAGTLGSITAGTLRADATNNLHYVPRSPVIDIGALLLDMQNELKALRKDVRALQGRKTRQG